MRNPGLGFRSYRVWGLNRMWSLTCDALASKVPGRDIPRCVAPC